MIELSADSAFATSDEDAATLLKSLPVSELLPHATGLSNLVVSILHLAACEGEGVLFLGDLVDRGDEEEDRGGDEYKLEFAAAAALFACCWSICCETCLSGDSD